jgi:hypothetical protein
LTQKDCAAITNKKFEPDNSSEVVAIMGFRTLCTSQSVVMRQASTRFIGFSVSHWPIAGHRQENLNGSGSEVRRRSTPANTHDGSAAGLHLPPTAPIDAPSASLCNAFCRRVSSSGGLRPKRFPSTLALALPGQCAFNRPATLKLRYRHDNAHNHLA